MTTADLMAELRRRGIELKADGNRLRFRPVSAVPPDLRAAMTEHKAEILAVLAGDDLPIVDPPGTWAKRAAGLLAGIDDPDRRADLREAFEHRAGVCEFDGGLSRDGAEALAYREIAAKLRKGT